MIPLLGERVVNAVKAREVLVAPRLPDPPKVRTGDPFADDADLVVDCDVDGCGWHAMGPRADVKLAVVEHHRLYHPEQTGVVLLNAPRQ